MIEHIKRIVGEYLSQFVRPKYGTVTSYDSNTYRVKVMLHPEEIETGWIQLSAPFVGGSFGAVFGPSIGDLARVDFLEGSAQAAIMGGRFFHDGLTPPSVGPGEVKIISSSGVIVSLDKTGTLTLSALSGAGEIDINAKSVIKITAPDVQIQGINFASHVHGGVLPGGGTTGIPKGPA
ncbi:MAG: hypothetical protein B7Z80_10370 [Rhodospirillales bacterium 20-64-7]|nr:MAG: hypothetical protein B7Z80_10370 [Rhodospirillales bacterium 20-64-7]